MSDSGRAKWLADYAAESNFAIDKHRDAFLKLCLGLFEEARVEERSVAAGFPPNMDMHCWWCLRRQQEVSKFFASSAAPFNVGTKLELGIELDAVIDGMEGMCHPSAYVCDRCIRVLSDLVGEESGDLTRDRYLIKGEVELELITVALKKEIERYEDYLRNPDDFDEKIPNARITLIVYQGILGDLPNPR